MNLPMSENRYRFVMWIPPVVLIVFLTWGFAREWVARQNVESRVAELASEGVPTTHIARLNLLDEVTSRNQSAAWSDLLEASDALSNLTRDRVQQEDELIPPGKPWAAEAFANAISENAQPVLDELNRLLEQDDLVWQPYSVNSYWYWAPSLTKVQSLSEVLADEFRLAVHAGDNELAIECLKKHDAMRQRFDWPVERAINMQTRLRNKLNKLIRQSVSFDFWTTEQLAEIQQMLASSMNEELAGSNERVVGLAEFLVPLNVDGGDPIFMGANAELQEVYSFGVSPMHAEMAIEMMEGVDPIDANERSTDVRAMPGETSAKTRRQLADQHRSWVSVPNATLSRQMARYWNGLRTSAADRLAINDSRWTMTAVAIRQFGTIEDRFPISLEELTSVGLTRQSWTLTFGGPLGYRLDDEGASAVLWTYYPNSGKNGMNVPPVPHSEHTMQRYNNDLYEVWFDEKP